MIYPKDLLIYQMGRVGSNSVFETVRSEGIKSHHFHNLIGSPAWDLPERIKTEETHWWVISLVREPLARNWSAYNFFKTAGDFIKDFNHIKILTWFEENIEVNFGIDVYDEPFDHLRGWQLYKNDKLSLLLIRTEDLTEKFSEAFEVFLGVPLELRHFPHRYKTPKWGGVIPQDLIDKMYSSKLSKHFYTAEELENFKTLWTGPYG